MLVVLIVDRADLVTFDDDDATFAEDNVITPLLRIIIFAYEKQQERKKMIDRPGEL